jgi:hypothetical protein
VNKCFEDSFIKDNISFELKKNKILDDELEMKGKSGILFFPGVVINNMTYHGNLNAVDILNEICRGKNSFA